MTEPTAIDLTETQKAYNVASSNMFQLAAYGHHRYHPLVEALTDEGKRQQRDYNDRLGAAREELEAALLRLVAEHAETFPGERGPAWLRSLADDPGMLSLLAVHPDERDFDTDPVSSAVAQSAPAETALRDRIAALFRHPPGAERLGDATPGEIADAVLAVLPVTVDRADVLRWAADQAYRIARRLDEQQHDERAQGAWDVENAIRAELRRVAAEARTTETDDTVSAAELAHAIDNSTPYPIELDGALCRHMAAQLLEMVSVHKRPEHAVWQPEEPPGPSPEPMDPAVLATDEGRLRCPRCREDITNYFEDDFVFRTGDERPYCSGECVVAAHRKNLPTASAVPVQHAPGVAILCPDCGAKGYSICMDDAVPQPDREA